MMKELVVLVKERLSGAGNDNAQREAEWIVEAATGLDRASLAASQRPPTPDEESMALRLMERRVNGEPLQYVTGVAGFRRLELAVGPGVFIPRPESESLAGRAMDLLPDGGIVVDIGTGSGAVALSIADERPDARVWATDFSADALVWAERNRDALGLDVRLSQADLFDGLDETLKGRIDIVVSNPPYVPAGFSLGPEVVDHEPHVALFADESGLGIIEKLLDRAKGWLNTPGWIVLEIGEVQRDAVMRLMKDAGFDEVAVHDDLAGRPRIAECRWS
jgi:release factor glutamine methyltransferase